MFSFWTSHSWASHPCPKIPGRLYVIALSRNWTAVDSGLTSFSVADKLVRRFSMLNYQSYQSGTEGRQGLWYFSNEPNFWVGYPLPGMWMVHCLLPIACWWSCPLVFYKSVKTLLIYALEAPDLRDSPKMAGPTHYSQFCTFQHPSLLTNNI